MSRRTLALYSLVFGALAVLGGCARPVAEALPAEVNGWRRAKTDPVEINDLAPAIRERSPDQAVRAEYTNGERISVLLVRLQTEPSAFALMQSWRHREGVQPFYRGRLFGYAEGANRKDLIAFVRAFRDRLPE